MKKFFTILVCLIFSNVTLGVQGELIIKFLAGTPEGTFGISVSSTNPPNYSWHWENNEVVLDNTLYSHSAVNKSIYTFGSPKSPPNHGDYKISWGLLTFTITTNSGLSRTFQLDLRDERWAEGYPNHDTYILIDELSTPKKIYISRGDGINPPTYYLEINNGNSFNIWDFWVFDLPAQTNFKIPVTLKNRIEEGPSTDFGSLWANNHEVASGTSEGFRYLTSSNNVQHYTLETEYSNERKYSFQWSSININALGNQNIYSSSFGFTLPINLAPKDVTRNFRTVWPLKLKNVSIESNNTESFGSIYFKDPTTDNQFHLYLASGENGFEKNEAFHNLNEIINNQPNQQYAVKTVPSVLHNGRNYYWYGGDFNPNTPTDFLVTAPSTKTANFKGTQLSSQTDAYNSTS